MSSTIMRFREEARNLLHRFPPLYRLCLIYVRESGKVYYYFLNKKHHYSDQLKKLKDSQKGKRCFIIGNGPSLTVADLEKLKKEDCFGSNRIFKVFSDTSWRPKYYAVDDWRGITTEEGNALDIQTIFFGDYFYRKHRIKNKNAIVFYGNRTLDLREKSFRFSNDISKEVYIGATVSFVLIQIAAYMGYSEIYLLGMDHSYSFEVDSTGKVVKNQSVEHSHFFKDEASTRVVGNVEGMNNAYLTAKKYAEAHGIKIYNATRGGKLEIYDRVDFDTLFQGEK